MNERREEIFISLLQKFHVPRGRIVFPNQDASFVFEVESFSLLFETCQGPAYSYRCDSSWQYNIPLHKIAFVTVASLDFVHRLSTYLMSSSELYQNLRVWVDGDTSLSSDVELLGAKSTGMYPNGEEMDIEGRLRTLLIIMLLLQL